MPVSDFVNSQENQYYSGKLIVPFVVTSKPIMIPITNEKDEIVDIQEIKFVLYEHSVLKLNNYTEILEPYSDLGIFVCNEKYFDECLDYIENIFKIIFKEITSNLSKQPLRLIEDFKEIKKKIREKHK